MVKTRSGRETCPSLISATLHFRSRKRKQTSPPTRLLANDGSTPVRAKTKTQLKNPVVVTEDIIIIDRPKTENVILGTGDDPKLSLNERFHKRIQMGQFEDALRIADQAKGLSYPIYGGMPYIGFEEPYALWFIVHMPAHLALCLLDLLERTGGITRRILSSSKRGDPLSGTLVHHLAFHAPLLLQMVMVTHNGLTATRDIDWAWPMSDGTRILEWGLKKDIPINLPTTKDLTDRAFAKIARLTPIHALVCKTKDRVRFLSLIASASSPWRHTFAVLIERLPEFELTMRDIRQLCHSVSPRITQSSMDVLLTRDANQTLEDFYTLRYLDAVRKSCPVLTSVLVALVFSFLYS